MSPSSPSRRDDRAPARAAARSCWSPASPARASRSRCTRSRTPASSASTTCRPSCCATSCAWSSAPQRPPRRDRGRRAQRRLAAAPAAAARRAARRRRARSGRSSSTPAPTRWCAASPRRGARIRCRTDPSRGRRRSRHARADRRHRARARAAGRAARGVHRDRHQPAAPGAAARAGCATSCGAARQPPDAGLRVVRLQARRAARRRLRVRRARAAQPALHPRAAAAHRPRRARWPPTSRRSPRSVEMLAQIEAFLARWLPAFERRPAQLPHGGDRLHRRPAPLGVLRRAAGAALRGARGARWCAIASWTHATAR